MSLYFLIMIISSIALMACSDTGNDDDDDDDDDDASSSTITLSFTGLEALTNDYHYEGWAIVDGAAVSTGKFNVSDAGALVDLSGNAIAGGAFEVASDLSGATRVVISIEPSGDTDTTPADTKVLAGDVSSSSASLTVGSMFGDDFTSSTGSYILATPTDNDGDSNETSGIWFLDNSGSEATAGLSLPTLPAGWKYEGWVVISGTPVSTGTFTSASGADDAAPYSDTAAAGPAFPGEDFLANAPSGLTFPVSIQGATAVISIEPSPDDSTAPFTLKPLTASIASDAEAGTVYTMTNNATPSSPTGSATIQ